MLILKVIFLFLAVYFSILEIEGCFVKQINKYPTERLVLQTIGIVGFITLQFLI